jgi:hypothetical protein
MKKEVVKAQFKVLSWHLPEGLRNTTTYSQCSGSDLNWAPSEYNSEAILLELTCSVGQGKSGCDDCSEKVNHSWSLGNSTFVEVNPPTLETIK